MGILNTLLNLNYGGFRDMVDHVGRLETKFPRLNFMHSQLEESTKVAILLPSLGKQSLHAPKIASVHTLDGAATS